MTQTGRSKNKSDLNGLNPKSIWIHHVNWDKQDPIGRDPTRLDSVTNRWRSQQSRMSVHWQFEIGLISGAQWEEHFIPSVFMFSICMGCRASIDALFHSLHYTTTKISPSATCHSTIPSYFHLLNILGVGY